MEFHELTIESARKLLFDREISSFELTSALLDRIGKYDDEIGAFITVDKELVLEQAKKADQDIANKNTSGLTGVPIALKDLLCTKGMKTTCASKILNNFVPQYDGTVVKKLKENGAIIIGKTNMDEFAM
ncbi:MAG: Asp-tRNA(Asn)/Glu-tRNA(Gln) amidotransferase subunit GatA, partial [Desulfobacula sp.]|nr:Asp-tRNA(Asn)/Glu-tRNA(Gln) amidotransferase subunit GatA [Desulfobacula sp.]